MRQLRCSDDGVIHWSGGTNLGSIGGKESAVEEQWEVVAVSQVLWLEPYLVLGLRTSVGRKRLESYEYSIQLH